MKTTGRFNSAMVAMALLAASNWAAAIPTLQLGITDGIYDAATQTVTAGTTRFELAAYLLPDAKNPLSDTYHLSIALTPTLRGEADLGSFGLDGVNYRVTGDLPYGTPPIDIFNQAYDPGDLSRHGVFPTHFIELAFNFDATDASARFNTQEHPTWGPQGGTGMYFHTFAFDVTDLSSDYALHFDLYNTRLKTSTDVDVTQFAPFSHDAESGFGGRRIPEPGSLTLLAVGLPALVRSRLRNVAQT